MNNLRSLKILDSLKWLFKWLGVNYSEMRKILQLKLTMDQRRVPTIFEMENTKKKQDNQFLKSLWLYGLYGLILLPFLFIGDHYMLQMGLFFGIIMFILMTSMISDFTSVLLDLRDKHVLGTKPVSKKSISAAKMVHVTIYMTLMTGAFLIIPFIVMIVAKSFPFALLFLGLLVLNVLLIIALTALVYMITLQFFSGEQLKNIINYVQILLSVGIIVGYQLLARSFDVINLAMTYTFSWWHIFIPPFWFAAPFEWLLEGHPSGGIIFLSLLAVVIPTLAMIIYARLMPSFERNLEKLLNTSAKSKRSRFKLDDLWSRLVCFTREERVFLQFAYAMMKKERQFKLKVYPVLGMALFFPFIFLFNTFHNGITEEVGDGKTYLTIYVSSILIPAAVQMLKYSENHQSGWIFHAAPIADPNAFHRGAVKAFIVKLYLPVFLVVSAVYLFLFSARIIPDLFVVFLSACLHTVISYQLLNRGNYPFSQPFSTVQNANTGLNILLSLIAGLFALIHFIALHIHYGLYGYMALLLIATIVGWLTVLPKYNSNRLHKA